MHWTFHSIKILHQCIWWIWLTNYIILIVPIHIPTKRIHKQIPIQHGWPGFNFFSHSIRKGQTYADEEIQMVAQILLCHNWRHKMHACYPWQNHFVRQYAADSHTALFPGRILREHLNSHWMWWLRNERESNGNWKVGTKQRRATATRRAEKERALWAEEERRRSPQCSWIKQHEKAV